ncbi:hypothetical protein D0862_04690 [Hortaea werneckii]|uniref:Phosducin domain-containing protein n=1 Tax=Hortaea werneckii TaxID=91943 RepID=A0A3M7GZ28_HORWE|nr:hypothetical protein D0862_04690 [Hortaea werneckii]
MSAAQNEFNELMRNKETRTRHPEDDDSDDAQSFLHLSDDDGTPPASRAASDDEAVRPSMSSARSTIPRTRYGANTGPKGVISDAQDYRDSQRQHRASLRTQASQAQRGANLQDKPIAEKLEESDGEDDLDDDLDDDFMQRWRRGRLQELQNGRRDSQMHNRGRDRRVWGKLVAVDGEGYLEAIEKSPSDTVVVVYIYDSYSDVSNAIEECIRAVARRHLNTRFVKLSYEDAEMEPAGVPAVIAYRGGDKFAGLVPVFDELPDDADLSERTLEAVMQRYAMLEFLRAFDVCSC